MKRSGWLLAGPGLLLWIAALAVPAIMVIGQLFSAPGADEPDVRHPLRLLGVSVGWALATAIPATLLAWPVGRTLAAVRAGRVRRVLPLAIATMVPVFLPGYLASYAWWQAFGPDAPIGAWIARSDLVVPARSAALWLGLLCWSWPFAAWGIAVSTASDADLEEALRVDGAAAPARWRALLRIDAPALLLAAVLVMLAVLGNTAAFDLAQVRSFGFELRSLDAQGASAGTIARAGVPAAVVAMLLGAFAWWALARTFRRPGDGAGPPLRSRAATVWCWTLVAVSGGLPLVLLVWRLGREARPREFLTLYGEALGNTLAMAFGGGLAAALLAVATCVLSLDGRAAPRRVADLIGVSGLVAAALPTTVLVLGLVALYNRPGPPALIYDSPLIVMLGLLACFGFVGAVVGRAAALAEPSGRADVRRLDAAVGVSGVLRTAWPALLAAGGGAGAAVFALGMGEVVATARLQPPGWDALAAALLNAIHYQYLETVMTAIVILLIIALLAAAGSVVAWLPLRRGAAPTALLLVGAIGLAVLPGCRRNDPETLVPVPVERTFGAPGVFLGQFNYPRAISSDPAFDRLYVIDKTARIQRFAPDGTPESEWDMPEWESGKPTGLSVDEDGTVFVADTHYFRVVVFDPDGREIMRFGEYGKEPGQFIYTTDVAFGPDDLLYVGEYGGNDRIQVFDREGVFQFEFGTFGSGPEQLSRPQSLAFSADRSELYIADACNHRIVVTDPAGEVQRILSGVGRGPGQLMYPYGLEVLPDGSLLVAEFGNNRIQRLDASDGRTLGLWGGLGFPAGRLQYPWGVARIDDEVFVLDSGNNRVQVMAVP